MIGELGWDAKFIPKGPKGGKTSSCYFLKIFVSQESLQKTPTVLAIRYNKNRGALSSRLDASENELSDEAGAVRMVKRFASSPSQVGSEKICGFHRLECAWLVVSKAFATREKVRSA